MHTIADAEEVYKLSNNNAKNKAVLNRLGKCATIAPCVAAPSENMPVVVSDGSGMLRYSGGDWCCSGQRVKRSGIR
jgi:hypothetical protein